MDSDPRERDEDDPGAGSGYSIRGKYPDDLTAQQRLAAHHLDKARLARERAERKTLYLRTRADELRYQADAVEKDAEGEAGRNEGFVRHWLEDPVTRRLLGDKVPLDAATVRIAKVRQTTTVSEDAARAWALLQDETNQVKYLIPKYAVSKDAIRERFMLSGSDVVDTETGVVLEPVKYYGPDGTELSSPLIVETRPAGEQAVIKYNAPKAAQGEGQNGRGTDDTGDRTGDGWVPAEPDVADGSEGNTGAG